MYSGGGERAHEEVRKCSPGGAPGLPRLGNVLPGRTYADALATGNLHGAEDFSWWRKYFPNQNLNAYAGFGWLFHNSNYFARPDNTGRALFRYVAHVDLDLYKNRVVLYGDTNFFTDRELSNKLKPTELDWIVGLAVRFKDDYEVSVYREQDLSLDKPGTLIQEYWAVQLRFAFDVPKRLFRGVTSQQQK